MEVVASHRIDTPVEAIVRSHSHEPTYSSYSDSCQAADSVHWSTEIWNSFFVLWIFIDDVSSPLIFLTLCLSYYLCLPRSHCLSYFSPHFFPSTKTFRRHVIKMNFSCWLFHWLKYVSHFPPRTSAYFIYFIATITILPFPPLFLPHFFLLMLVFEPTFKLFILSFVEYLSHLFETSPWRQQTTEQLSTPNRRMYLTPEPLVEAVATPSGTHQWQPPPPL